MQSQGESEYGYECPIKYNEEFRRDYEDPASETSSELEDYIDVDMADEDTYEDLDDACPKYLIFSTGSRTYTPHQIGIKVSLSSSKLTSNFQNFHFRSVLGK